MRKTLDSRHNVYELRSESYYRMHKEAVKQWRDGSFFGMVDYFTRDNVRAFTTWATNDNSMTIVETV